MCCNIRVGGSTLGILGLEHSKLECVHSCRALCLLAEHFQQHELFPPSLGMPLQPCSHGRSGSMANLRFSAASLFSEVSLLE